MYLTDQQLKTFNEDGFLLIRNFITPQEAHTMLLKAKALVLEARAPIESEEHYHDLDESRGFTLRRLRQVYDRDPLISSWMTSEEIRPILKQILGENAVLTLAHHNSIMTKMPSEISNTCWHQDRRYWDFENDKLLSVWLAMGEERMENGLLEFIAGSHLEDLDPDQFDAKVCFKNDLEKNQELISKRVHVDLNPGDVVLFHCKTLHSAHANQTKEPKISLVYTVRGESNLPLSNTRSSRHPEIPLI
ncbi:MAG: phytanoyl-CoA dioxygenase family protein [Campylobacterota bacterium]|nr:phytanoyl-CoA dioxygenase family protein [Campylobacterota bacterium]